MPSAVRISLLLLLLAAVCVSAYAENPNPRNIDAGKVIESLQQSALTSALIAESLSVAVDTESRPLAVFIGRRLSRDFPFSSSLAELLDLSRSGAEFSSLPGISGTAYLIPLPALRLVALIALVITVSVERFRRTAGWVFMGLICLCLAGEVLNFKRHLSGEVFIPLDGEHFALSAPAADAVAVEKLFSAAEIAVGDYRGDWVQLILPSGRIGWIRSHEGLIDEG